jgi:8-oxo-dGTP diphosphatase
LQKNIYKMPYTYDYPRPALTVDCVIFGKDETADLKVLLIQRANEPFKGKWAFPGGFVDENESADHAAERELFEETAVENVKMKQFYTFTQPHRDPRGWTVSIAFYTTINMQDCVVQAGDDAGRAEWINIHDIREMAFDHTEILAKALELIGY